MILRKFLLISLCSSLFVACKDDSTEKTNTIDTETGVESETSDTEDDYIYSYADYHYKIFLSPENDLLGFEHYIDNVLSKKVTYTINANQLEKAITNSETGNTYKSYYELNEDNHISKLLVEGYPVVYEYNEMGQIATETHFQPSTENPAELEETNTYPHEIGTDTYIMKRDDNGCVKKLTLTSTTANFNVSYFEAQFYGLENMPLSNRHYEYLGCPFQPSYRFGYTIYEGYELGNDNLVNYVKITQVPDSPSYDTHRYVYDTTFEYIIQ